MYDHGGMNRFYRLVWSEAKGCYIPIPEVSQKRGKRKGGVFASLAAAALALLSAATGALADPGPQVSVAPAAVMQQLPPADNALPTGGQVVGGNATISQSGSTQTITQTSQNAAIDWQSFDIGKDGKVVFNQPNASAIALNRVLGGDASKIYGVLQANGQVFLVNPNGVLFAKGAQVSAAAIMASTRDISVADFMAGKYRLSGTGNGTIVNDGTLTAGQGGYIALVGAQVINTGTISAAKGDVRLVAANDVTIRLDTGGLDLTIDQGGYDALVSNGGVIKADNGRIYLTADAFDALAKASVNNSGIIEAAGVTTVGGKVVLTGTDITLAEGSKIDASGDTGGGTVLVGGGWQGKDASITNARNVTMSEGAVIDVSAKASGDGGTAVLWSEDRTAFGGQINAKGGANGGNGGQIETSGHMLLDVTGSVDASSTKGEYGQWLLDPYNVIIASSGQSGSAYANTYNPAQDSIILASSVQSGLSNANVTITTGASGGSAGNITLNAPINRSGGATKTLTLLAANDIIINNTIQSTVGSLNVVLTADSDNSGVGSIQFTSAGKVITNSGNFFAGNLTSSSLPSANQKRGQDFTMAAGSLIDAGGAMLDINVNGTISLAADSIRNAASFCCVTAMFNDGTTTNASNYLSLSGGSIVSTNASATTRDIYARVGVTLAASSGDIGSSSHAVTISGGDPSTESMPYSTLTVSNSGGSTWINEIGTQHTTSANVSIGSQLNSEHHIDFLDDANSTGMGHIDLTTDGSGVIQVANNGIRMGGDFDWDTYEGTYPVNLTLSGGTIQFASGSVDMGTASLTVSATTMRGTNDGIADIIGGGITLLGSNIGTSINPLELADNYFDQGLYQGGLSIYNSGGGTYLKSVNDGFGYLTFDYAKAAGTHSVLFSGGDHIDFVTNGNAIYTPTVSGGASDGTTFGATTGIDLTRTWRNLTLNAQDGDIILGDTSIRMGPGAMSWGAFYNSLLTLTINRGNTTGDIAAENNYNASSQVAQIYGGDVTFNVANEPTPTASTIGAGGKDIQIAEGVGVVDGKLSVSTYQGDVTIHEVSSNYLKSVAVSLGGGHAAQSIAVDLMGADDISFADSGSLIAVDATKVAVSANNRSFSLSASQRALRTDGNAFTTGSYSLSGRTLGLNGDIITNGGNISLSSSHGTNLLTSVLVDSNSDRLGLGGDIGISANYYSYNSSISATGAGRTLTANSSSTDNIGGRISVGDMIDNQGGAYLGGLSLNASGADTSQDGEVALGARQVLLDGNFSAYGKTSLGYYATDFVLRTAASNSGSAGNIIFGGDSLTYRNDRAATFNASTSANGGNGGTIDLLTASTTELEATTLSVTANGGSGGTKGAITLGAIKTGSSQTYSGSSITLHGDLTTTNAAMTLTGPVHLAESVTLTSGSGAMSLGTLSATTSGISATIGSTSDSGTLSALSADNGGGQYLNTLTVTSTSGRSMALGNIATEGTQTYTNGSATLSGAFSTNGGNISLSGITTLNNLSGNVSFDTDRAGGSGNAGQLIVGSKVLNGTGSLTIDTTADGGGTHSALTLNGTGASTAFSGIDIKAGSTTLNGFVRTSGNLLIEAQGAAADLTIASSGRAQTTGTSNTVILSAGRNFLNSATSGTGIQVAGSSRYLVYSANPANSTEGMSAYNKHYNEVYANGSTPSYASSGNWFLYSVAPVISVSSNASSITYGAADPTLTLSGSNYSGFIDGDTSAIFSGSQTLSLAAAGQLSGAGQRQVGTYAYTLNGTVTDSLGYQYALFSENLTVNPASIAVSGISAVNRDYDGTTAIALTGTPSAGSALSGDVVTVDVSGITASVADKNAGTGKTVLIGGSGGLTGADAGNYQLSPPVGLTVDIAKKALAIVGSAASNKTYDGLNTASVTAGTLSGFVGSETVTATAAGTFADKNAANGKSVTTTYTLNDGTNGGLAANYQLANDTLSADITKKTLNVTGSSVASKTYNGSDAATITTGTLSGFVGSETVTATGAGTFADKNAGTAKSVATTYTLNNGTHGGLASNYALADETLSGDINTKALNISGSSITGKTYDGSAAATVVAGTLSGLVGSETLSVSGAGNFANANAGTGKTVTATYTLTDGTGLASNYTLAGESLSGDIAKKTLNVTGSSVASKTYNGSDAATITAGTLSGFVGSETVTATAAGTFSDKNAANGKSVTTTYTLNNGTNGGLAGNYELAGETLTGNITKKALNVTGSSVASKTYNGSDAATITTGTLSGFVGSETVTATAAGTFADKNAGTAKSVATTYTLNNGTHGGLAANYELSGETLSGDINAKALNISGSSVTGKTYDGSASATIVAGTLSGLVGSESLGVSGSGTFANANAGTGKTVTATYSLIDGTGLASNYTLAGESLSGDIAKKTLGITGSTVATKTYDRTTSATITAGTLTGLVGSESLSVTGAGSFGDWNAGSAKSVVTTYTLGNGTGLAGNYELAGETLSGIISKKTISLIATGQNKTYNGSDAISVTVASNDIISGDTVTFTGTGAASDKNAGLNKTVNVTGITSGSTDAANYDYGTTATTMADIAKKSVTVTATGQNKTYDGSDAVGVTLASTGLISGDTVNFSGTGTASDKNAGTGKTVNVTVIGATGTDANNYDFNATASTTANIAKKTVTITATGQNKTYDGGTSVGVTVASADIVSGDVVAFTGTGALTDKNAGTAKTVNVSGINATGTDAGNYDYATTASTTANVAKKTVAVTTTGQNKTYDGSASVGVAVTSADIISGDTVAFTGTGTASDKNAGAAKTVTVTGINATGTDAGNYDYATSGSTTVDIAKKAITVAAAGQNKTYDGSAAVGVSLTSGGVVTGDSVTFSGTGTASDKNAGAHKAVTVGNFAVTGTDADNYDVTAPVSTTVDVAKKTITVAATGQNKTYDGGTSVGVSLTSGDIVSGDTVAFTGTGALTDKNAGTGKTVNVTGIAAAGTDAANYDFATTASTTANVAKKTVTVTATGQNKTYDGSASVGVTVASADILGGDSVAFSGTGTASDKNAGTGKTVNVTGIAATGTDAGNYDFATTGSTTTNIAKKAIAVAATGQDKTYDGGTSVGVDLTSTGVVTGDSVTFAGTGTASNKNAGTGKTVTVGNFAVTGTDADNYDVTAPVSTTVNIAKKAISVVATGQNKTYDGGTSVGVGLTSGGLVTGDSVAFSGTGTAADKNAGTAKTVTVGNFAVTGTDADNYDVTAPVSTTVDIARKTITVAATGQNKTYNGSASVGVGLTSDGIVDGDTVAFTGTGTASDKHAGAGKTVAVSGIAASGTDADNYAYNTTAATTVDIAKKSVTVTATGQDKVYDGSTSVGIDLASNGIVDGDAVAFDGTGTASDKNAGADKTVAVSNIAATGTDAGNYTYNTTAATTADVAKKTVTVDAEGTARAYDGTTSVGVTLTSGGIVDGDSVAFSGTGTASDKNASTGKTVTVSNIAATGTDAGNYAYATTGATTVDIAKKAVTVQASAQNKTYDGSGAVTVALASNGIVAGDSVAFSGTGAASDKNAGTAKTVTVGDVAATGADAGNYAFAATTATTVDIATREFTVSLNGPVSKTGDGSAAAMLTSGNYQVAGLVAGETITVNQTVGAFTDAVAGKDKTVTAQIAASNYVAGPNTDLSNYKLASFTLTTNVGEIVSPTSPGYDSAVNTAVTNPAVTPPSATHQTGGSAAAPAVSTGEGDNAIAAVSDGGKDQTSAITPVESHEALTFRRTFAIADGGIRLPDGVSETDQGSDNK